MVNDQRIFFAAFKHGHIIVQREIDRRPRAKLTHAVTEGMALDSQSEALSVREQERVRCVGYCASAGERLLALCGPLRSGRMCIGSSRLS